MVPISHTPPTHLQAAMGFLVDVGSSEAQAAGEDGVASDARDATAGATEAAVGRLVQPLSAADLDDLQRDPTWFLRSPTGQALIREIDDDFQRLAAFADQSGLSTEGHDIREFCQRMPFEHAVADYWWELLTEGRRLLARVVAGMEDARIPLEERRSVLTELTRGLAHCGLRVRVELQRADRGLFGYRGALPQTVRRVFEQTRDEIIRHAVATQLGEDPRHQGLNVQRLVNVLQGLSLESSRVPLEFMTPAQFEAVLQHCERELVRWGGPNTLARRLAEECLETVRADLRPTDGTPLNLADHPHQMNRLHQLVGDLTARYGPLSPASFIELDDDALPQLGVDATLIALDIRRGMAVHGLAAPLVDEEALVIGQGADRLGLHVAGGHFFYVVMGDPALQERHPLRLHHVDRIAAEGSLSWEATAEGPGRWPLPVRRALLQAGIARMDPDALGRTSPNWIEDVATAQQFSARLDDASLPAWLRTVAHSATSDHGLKALMRVLVARPDVRAALSTLATVAPEVIVRMWPRPGRDWLESALRHGWSDECDHSLVLMGLAVRHLPAPERLEALTLPPAARLSTSQSFHFLGDYLHLLAALGEQDVITSSQVRQLLHADSPVSQVLYERFPFDPTLPEMLAALKRLCRSGLLSQADLIALLTSPAHDDGRLPHVVDAVGEPGATGVQTFMTWALEPVDRILTPATVEALIAPAMAPEVMEEPLMRVCVHNDPSALLAYLDGALRAWQQQLLPAERVTRLLRAMVRLEPNAAAPLLVYAQSKGQHAIATALLDWLPKALRAKALDGAGLLQVIDHPGNLEFGVLGAALRSHQPTTVRACVSVLDAALSLSILTPTAFTGVLCRAVTAAQPLARWMRSDLPPLADEGAPPIRASERHALDVLWSSLLPVVMSGRCSSDQLTPVITGRHAERADAAPLPTEILLGAYESLVNAALFGRQASELQMRAYHAAVLTGRTAPAPPDERPIPLTDDLLMRLLVCNSGTERTPVLNVALRGSDPALVHQLMGIAIRHLRGGRLTLPELAIWWQATGDRIEPAIHAALNSHHPPTLKAYLDQLLAAFAAPPQGAGGGAAIRDVAGRSTMLATLLGVRNPDLLTPAQAAVRRGAAPMLSLVVDAVLTAQREGLLSETAVTELLASEVPRPDAPPVPQRPSHVACQALLDDARERATAQASHPRQSEPRPAADH